MNVVRTTLSFAVVFCTSIPAQVTQRVSVGAGGIEGNGPTIGPNEWRPWLSEDGRFVVYASEATNLVPGDGNGQSDVFVRDRHAGTVELVSVATDGTYGNHSSDYPSISSDGRYVAFEAFASNLVAGDTNQTTDIFVHDRRTQTTIRVSVDSAGNQSNAWSAAPAISADGRHVSFFSNADNLVSGDTNGMLDVFVHDLDTGLTERVSIDSSGIEGDFDCGFGSSISADGRFVAFESDADNLVPGDTNGHRDVFVRDRWNGATERVSVRTNGAQQGLGGLYLSPSISSDGRYVAFTTEAHNLVQHDTNNASDCFVHDRRQRTTVRVSVGTDGAEGNNRSYGSFLSGDGRDVAFSSWASSLVAGDTNGTADVFVRDMGSGTTERVSVDSEGTQGELLSVSPAVSFDAKLVAFVSLAGNFVPGDTNETQDVFVRNRQGGTSFESLCNPGIDGVRNCPCANAPSGPDRGCNNSSATGGAMLSASGGTFVSSDSLVFTASGEPNDALSMLMQGNAVIPSGVIYGQGVRCLGGTILRRLFVAQASGGAIHVPDFGVGASTISARSAAKGDVIQPGQSRSYLVYYRDPIVLGGCPSARTFNATQTGLVSWAP